MLTTARIVPLRIVRQNTRAASAIATKYALAAYGAALKKSPATLDSVQKELAIISSTLKSNEKLSAFVTNPTLTAKDREAGLQVLFQAIAGTEEDRGV